MFDIGWSELLLIGVVALIAIGPKELPGVLRAVGQWTGKIRRMAAEFQGQFQEALREAEMTDLKKQVDELNDAARSITSFDPLADQPKPVADTPPPGSPADAATAALPAPEAGEASAPPPEPQPAAGPLAAPATSTLPAPAASTEPVAGAASPVETPPATPVPVVPAPAEATPDSGGAPVRTASEPAAVPAGDRPA